MSFFVTLASGRNFDFANPQPEMICLDDVVHHLSRENRWANNIEPVSFTVAQHSMVVASACRLPQSRPYALLHDVSEMVTRDLPTPLKRFLRALGADLEAFEQDLMRDAVYPAFGLPPPGPAIVGDLKCADAIALATEWRDIVKGRSGQWAPTAKPLTTRLRWIPQPMVEERFRQQLELHLRPFGKVI